MFILILVIFSIISVNGYNNLQGIEYLAVSYDVLTGENVQEIFDFTYSGRTVCHKGICYNMPDQFDFYDLNECDTRGKTELIRTTEEWKETYSTKVTVSMDAGLFSSVSGSKSSSYEEFHSTTNEYQSVTTNVYIGCDEYEMVVRPTTLKLSENIYADIFKLPTSFNDDSREFYFNFFRKYGTVWIYRTKLGGRMNGNAFTEYTYLQTIDEVTMTEQMTASFFAQITHETEYSSKLTKEYNESTHTYEISSYGGEYFDPTDKDITTWTSTIHKAPVIVFKELYPLTELFNGIWVYDQTLVQYYNPIKMAIEAYLNISGCIDMRAENYNREAVIDDGSCLFIKMYTDEYIITSKTQDPDLVGIQMIHSDEGFCVLTYTEWCESECRVEINSTNGYWYIRSEKRCTASPDIYCGARCIYTNVVLTANNNENIVSSTIDALKQENMYVPYISYNPNYFDIKGCSKKTLYNLMHSSDGFCYVMGDDYHSTQCQTQIDENGYWYSKSLLGSDGHNCDLSLCRVMCANIKYEKNKNFIN